MCCPDRVCGSLSHEGRMCTLAHTLHTHEAEVVLQAAFAYYIEHPDELPEDVAQAVRNMDAAEAEKAFQSMLAYRAEMAADDN